MSRVVLDASAILALLNDEPGGERVAAALPGAAVSAVNLSEVMAKLAENGMPGTEIATALAVLGLQVHSFDEKMALAAAMLRLRTKPAGLSFGDRACLALGLGLSRPVVTADRSWRSLRLGVRVEVIR